IFPPEASLRLTTDIIEFTVQEIPKWNPINICSYHLQEAGATPVQEVAYTLSTAIAVLDAIDVPDDVLPRVVGRIAFFCNSGIRFIEEMCKMRVFGRLWDRITRERYGVDDPKLRRFRYGVQVNSLGLTAEQPENNIPRIVLESLGVLLSRDARARALQLPAWNEALGLPQPWDQQWSLRIQQILAHETDLLEYPDLFEGSVVIEEKVRELEQAAWAEIERIEGAGGAIAAVRQGSMKRAMVESNRARLRAIEDGQQVVVGVNRYEAGESSPLVAHGTVVTPTQAAEQEQVDSLQSRRQQRDAAAVDGALAELREALQSGANVMSPSIRCAHAGVTTGEWTDALRECLGEYRPPTGLDVSQGGGPTGPTAEQLRRRVDEVSHDLGRRLKLLVGKPGLDGHSNGAELLALAARDAGLEVVYAGIRQTPQELIAAAIQEGVHLVGLSVLSGSHMTLVPTVVDGLDVPVVVGGIIPEADAADLRQHGVAAVYTPRDHDLSRIVGEMIEIAAKGRARV
ncbi:MAG TPA: protein meaA, partial [Deltaproteobacteria bacterium]|nr:protein meaA [Deltaproteobacteria bacterium]